MRLTRRAGRPRLLLGSAFSLLALSCTPASPFVEPQAQSQPLADAIVVLGNRPPLLDDGQMNPELLHRLRFGIKLYKLGYAPRLLMTGGPSEVGVEAEIMRDKAVELGVPASAILVEGRSQDTIENARLSRELLCTKDQCLDRVIVVSNPYHSHRATKLFSCAGFDAVSMPAPRSERSARNHSYEQRVAFAYFFIDECQRARGPEG